MKFPTIRTLLLFLVVSPLTLPGVSFLSEPRFPHDELEGLNILNSEKMSSTVDSLSTDTRISIRNQRFRCVTQEHCVIYMSHISVVSVRSVSNACSRWAWYRRVRFLVFNFRTRSGTGECHPSVMQEMRAGITEDSHKETYQQHTLNHRHRQTLTLTLTLTHTPGCHKCRILGTSWSFP